MLLKGSILCNTDWVVGIVVYTGHDTKLMQNQTKSRHKQSRVERENNFTILCLLIFLIVEAIVLSLFGRSKHETYTKHAWYLGVEAEQSTVIYFFTDFMTIIVLNATFIPISLMMNIEVVKVT